MAGIVQNRFRQVIIPLITFLIIQLVVTLVAAYAAGEGWLQETEMSAVASLTAGLINSVVLVLLDRKLSIGAVNREQITGKFEALDPGRKAGSIVLILLTAFCANLFFNGVVMLIGVPKFDPLYQSTAETFVEGSFPMQIIAFGIVVPVAEELLFRGFIFNVVRTRFAVKASVVITALIFAVYHGNLTQGLYAFGIGVMLCLVCEEGGLLFSVLLHLGVNLVSLIGNRIDLYTSTLEHISQRWYVVVLSGILMVLLFVIFRKTVSGNNRVERS